MIFKNYIFNFLITIFLMGCGYEKNEFSLNQIQSIISSLCSVFDTNYPKTANDDPSIALIIKTKQDLNKEDNLCPPNCPDIYIGGYERSDIYIDRKKDKKIDSTRIEKNDSIIIEKDDLIIYEKNGMIIYERNDTIMFKKNDKILFKRYNGN